MELTDHPGRVIRHEPGACSGCGAGLADAEQTGMERRPVTEIPQVKATVTEHQMIEKTCACCGQATRAQAPDGVNAPVQYGPRASALAAYLWHGQFLSRDRACQALGDMFGCEPSPGAVAAMARKIAAFCSPAIKEIVQALIASEVAHFDETGFRVAGKLAWVHSASAGKHVLVTVHARRGTEGMDAAEVLPSFTGIAVHDAWAPYDTYDGVAGHGLCGAHVLRELAAVTENGTDLDVIWAQQAIDALLALNLDPPAHSGRSFRGRFLHEEFSEVNRGASVLPLACPAARPGSWARGRGFGVAVGPWRVRTGPGWSSRSGGRPAPGGEQVQPFVFAVPAFGQMQGEVAAAVPGGAGGDGDQVTADGGGPGLREGQGRQGAGRTDQVVRHGGDR
jgi:transposase